MTEKEAQAREETETRAFERKNRRPSSPGVERINAFSDGVFAIVITLMVLEIQLPNIPPELAAAELKGALWALAPRILAHFLTFALLGIYWVGHHTVFSFIKRYDRSLLWYNLVFLMFISLMPFPAGMIFEYGDQQITLILYCGVMVLAGISAAVMWWHASREHHLIDEQLPDEFIRLTYRRILLAPLLYLITIGLSYLNLTVAKLFLFLIVALYLFPNPLTLLHVHHVVEPGFSAHE